MTETLFPQEESSAEDRQVHDRFFAGSAGWSYDDWEGPFYPPGISSLDRLTYYSRQFRSVEIDSTFYGTPRLASVQGWYERTPDDFVFAAKFPRTITHDARLVGVSDETYHFIETMTELGEKLGPLLIQFPPSFDASHFGDLERFLEGLPDGLMYAVEVRHRSWLTDSFADLLENWSVSLCMSCSGGHLDRFWRVTSRVAYIRWLGLHDAVEKFDHTQIDRAEDVEWWIPRIRHFLDQGGVVFGYVNNHYAGHSPATIHLIQRRLREESAQSA